MTTNPYTLTEVAQNEMLDFAKYTVESRAIPSLIDGMKPVQRYYLYSSIKNSPKDFKKVSAVAGVVSDYGYNHGEVSAADAGSKMAADWKNNVCIVEGRGAFGTRQIQEAGASRYIYTRLSSNFAKYIKDLDLSPVHNDPEHEPPAFYIPILPLVLVNGASGIATGFATNILPRNEADIVHYIKGILNGRKVRKEIRVQFPQFNGTTTYNQATNRYECRGVYRKSGKTTLLIEEIPYSFDRESYIKVLDDLEDAGQIVSYEDKSDGRGFRFEVKLKQQISAKWSNAEIEKKFKLVKTYAENITVIDHAGNLREYDKAEKLVEDFIDYRLTVLQKRIDNKIIDQNELLRWLNVKIEFINAVLDDKIVFKNKTRKDVGAQTIKETSAKEEDVSRLLALNILTLTKEQVTQLKKEIKEANATLKYWKSTTTHDQFIEDLESIGA